MLHENYRAFLVEGYKRFKLTGDRRHIEDAIQLVKAAAPEHFFQGDEDQNLKKRVFYDEPYSAHWSGTYIRRYKFK